MHTLHPTIAPSAAAPALSHVAGSVAPSGPVAGAWRLDAGRAVSLLPREHGLLRIARGRVWVTGAGALGDQVLTAGECLAVAPGQHVVLEPFDSPGQGLAAALFEWERAVAAPPLAAPEWECSVARPLRELVRAWADGAGAVQAAGAGVAYAFTRLVRAWARYALGRLGVPLPRRAV